MSAAAIAPSISADTLGANLAALARWNPAAARLLRDAPARSDLDFFDTDDGVLGAHVNTGTKGPGQALASRRRPLAEARALAGAVDISQAGLYVVAGIGLGYHVKDLLARLARHGLVVAFEPDAGLLRAVLERVDCSSWLGEPNLRLLLDADDRGAMVGAMARAEGYVGLGCRLLEHPPSRARLADHTARFHRNLVDVIESVKMAVLTTLMQSRITIRNLTQNLDRYAASAGVADLAGIFRGRPALVVSAGPSLARNIDELARDNLRDRVVIIAAQTVLKPLLARGIRPHFVTTLDWSDVGRRFYEGLSAADVDGLTLVAEPKVNPAVLDAWPGGPGSLRCVADGLCDRLLGDALAGDKGSLPSGATVAHLAYYLARHLGCDPVALVGQDLGFTDAQYYASGASIHASWAGEVNEFNTLEMLEWQRIVRQGHHLRRAEDILGRPVYTDEQMVTYLTQFERDFADDAARGLSTIDATQGGVRKQHTTVRALAAFLDAQPRAGDGLSIRVPAVPAAARTTTNDLVAARVREVRRQVVRIGALSRRAGSHLAELIEHRQDAARVDRLISRIEPLTREVVALDPGYTLVHTLGQSVAFDRMRADRTLELESGLSPVDRQHRQAERDLGNVRALAETADELTGLLDLAVGALAGEPKVTRDVPAARSQTGSGIEAGTPLATVLAIIPIDPRDEHLRRPVAGHTSVLALTIARLRRCDPAQRIVLVGDDRAAIERFVALARVDNVEFAATEPGETIARRRQIRRARAFARACWRGGIGNATCYDEVYLPRSTPALLARLGADAALVLGPDWCLIDPEITRALIDRHRENPGDLRFVFTQAAPGLAPCLIARALAEQLAAAPATGPWSAAIGGILSYVPAAPMNDLIAGPGCVPVPATVRDAGRCFITDSPAALAAFERTLKEMGGANAPAAALIEALAADDRTSCAAAPAHLYLELSPPEPRIMLGADPRSRLDETLATGLIDELAAARPAARLTLAAGGDDGRVHLTLARLATRARRAGLGAVHIRTSLRCDADTADLLAQSEADVVSVDLLAHSTDGYNAVTGANDYTRVRANTERLLSIALANPEAPLVVPRLTRRDAVYTDLEPFFAQWIERAGWCVIESAAAPVPGERFAPLAWPASINARESRERLTILADGAAVAPPRWFPGASAIEGGATAGLAHIWRGALAVRALQPKARP